MVQSWPSEGTIIIPVWVWAPSDDRIGNIVKVSFLFASYYPLCNLLSPGTSQAEIRLKNVMYCLLSTNFWQSKKCNVFFYIGINMDSSSFNISQNKYYDIKACLFYSYFGIPLGGITMDNMLSISFCFNILSLTVVDVNEGDALTWNNEKKIKLNRFVFNSIVIWEIIVWFLIGKGFI